jgi:hypothetical protein
MSALGQKADIAAPPTNVCFTPKSGHWGSAVKCPLCAKSRHSALQQKMSLFEPVFIKRLRKCCTRNHNGFADTD